MAVYVLQGVIYVHTYIHKHDTTLVYTGGCVCAAESHLHTYIHTHIHTYISMTRLLSIQVAVYVLQGVMLNQQKWMVSHLCMCVCVCVCVYVSIQVAVAVLQGVMLNQQKRMVSH